MSSSKRAARGAAARRRDQRRRQQAGALRRRYLFFGTAAAVALVAIVGLIALNARESDGAELPAIVAGSTLDATIPRDGRVLGDPNAPLLVVEWGDYQCPACALVARDIQPRLIADYVATGKIRFTFRDFAFLDRSLALASNGEVVASGIGESVRAAEAAACAADQNAFWAFHDAVYANHHGENQGAYSTARLSEIARVAGLDLAAYTPCVEERTHQAEIERMFAERAELGINSTPVFVIEGKVVAIRGYDDLAAAIDAALAG